jgi:hypothetical protein
LPISAIDSISPAFHHAKQQLLEPFQFGQWARLALVGLLAGELASGGCNTNFQVPTRTSGTSHFAAAVPLIRSNPVLYATLIGLLIFAGVVLWLLFIYLNSVFRFILFDSIVERRCEIRRHWARRQQAGLRYFAWQLLLALAGIVGLTILIGVPAALGLAAGWLRQPKQHIAALILGGMVVFFAVSLFALCWLLVHLLTKDFVVPPMALDDVSAIEGWRRLWPMLRAEKGGYAGYLGMKIVMALGAAMVVGIAATLIILIVFIPVGGLGAVAVLTAKTAGLKWNLYTITLVILVGSFLLAGVLYLISFVSVPTTVFFPAYALYFFAARYPRLDALLHPAAATVPEAPAWEPPPQPPPLPPAPEAIG